MTTINLAEKIARKRKGLPEGNLSMKDRLQVLQGEGPQLSEKEKILLILFILGFGSIFGIRYYVTEVYIREKAEEVQRREAEVDQELAAAEAKMGSFQTIKEEIERFNVQVAGLKTKIGLIDSVQKGRNTIVRMVDFIINEMPQAVWLTRINVTKAGAPNTAQGGAQPPTPPPGAAPVPGAAPTAGRIEISGFALSLQLVSEFVKRLEGAVFFPSWQLVETTEAAPASITPSPNTTSIGSLGGAPPPDSKRFDINAAVVNQ